MDATSYDFMIMDQKNCSFNALLTLSSYSLTHNAVIFIEQTLTNYTFT